MRDSKIILSAVNFLTIIECSIEKHINEHGTAIISGYIESMDEERLLYLCTGNQFASIDIESDTKEKQTIFYGLIKSIKVETDSGLKKASVSLTGSTRILEGLEQTRTFQNKAMTYEDILIHVEKQYNKPQHLMHVGIDKVIGDMIVQYKETDWEFLKRLASHFNTCIIPHYKSSGIKYHFGLPISGFTKEIKNISYSVKKDVDEYMFKKDNHVKDIIIDESCYYEVESREAYDLGEGIKFLNKSLYVYAVHSSLVGAELLHYYILKLPGGFKLPKQYNYKLIGASLDSEILSVSKDTVKVCVKVDGIQNKSTAKWFPFSTVYSSPDGSGWYCMPEEKDNVRLYFPNEKEEEGYIISSVNVGSNVSGSPGGTPPRSNPDNKSISTKYNKQVELTPNSIMISNNKGMTILMDDEEGISIVSDKDVVIQSDENIRIESLNESISVEAKEFIELIQGETKISMKDDIYVEGAKLKVQ